MELNVSCETPCESDEQQEQPRLVNAVNQTVPANAIVPAAMPRHKRNIAKKSDRNFKHYAMRRNVPLKRKAILKRAIPKRMGKALACYYAYGLSISTWKCEECAGHIPHSERWQWFSAQAHILPKNLFPSVEAEPHNRLHLCPTCHTDWDSSWEKASTMKVFGLARVRLQSFIHKITEKLPSCFQ